MNRKGRIRARTVTAEITLDKPLLVTSLHLGKCTKHFFEKSLNLTFFQDYRAEPLRLEELTEIRYKMSELLEDPDCRQIWCGDFNALTRSDYSEEEWKEIANVRARNMWESPKTELMQKVVVLKIAPKSHPNCCSVNLFKVFRNINIVTYVLINNANNEVEILKLSPRDVCSCFLRFPTFPQ